MSHSYNNTVLCARYGFVLHKPLNLSYYYAREGDFLKH